ncbi:MAG: HEAT repeat domain-containing protein [Geminicoccaceae bacterium]
MDTGPMRLRNERQFDQGEGLRSPRRRIPELPAAAPIPLSDEQMASFVANGYLVLDPDLPPELHRAIFEKFVEINGADNDHDVGNNILPLVPEIAEVFDSPTIRGALGSILGPDYIMHPHRALHSNPPGSPPQAFHHDTYWGYKRKVHNHHPYWVMVMYYPQSIDRQIGPTGVVGGSQCIAQRLDDIAQIETPAEGRAGTCMLIHFDIWHRKMQNFTQSPRFMLKFQFVRMRQPTRPHWDNRSADWPTPAQLPAYAMEPVWREHWSWLRGQQGNLPRRRPQLAPSLDGLVAGLKAADAHARRAAITAIASLGPAAEPVMPQLLACLDDPSEPVGLAAAYTLGGLGEVAIEPLLAAMRANDGPNVDDARVFIDEGQKSEIEMRARNAAHGLLAIGPRAAPALVAAMPEAGPRMRKYIAFVLGELANDTPEVHAVLAAAARDADEHVRINAIEALGLKRGSAPVLAALVEALHDVEDEVRFNAALALARLGPDAEPATGELVDSLQDGNRYVVGYTVEALTRIGTAEALRAVMRHLKAARWCPMTNNRSLF